MTVQVMWDLSTLHYGFVLLISCSSDAEVEQQESNGNAVGMQQVGDSDVALRLSGASESHNPV